MSKTKQATNQVNLLHIITCVTSRNNLNMPKAVVHVLFKC